MELSTEIVQAMIQGANPLFLVGLITLHERQPLTVEKALREASNVFYMTQEKKAKDYHFKFKARERKRK
jgi:hypothetical protein